MMWCLMSDVWCVCVFVVCCVKMQTYFSRLCVNFSWEPSRIGNTLTTYLLRCRSTQNGHMDNIYQPNIAHHFHLNDKNIHAHTNRQKQNSNCRCIVQRWKINCLSMYYVLVKIICYCCQSTAATAVAVAVPSPFGNIAFWICSILSRQTNKRSARVGRKQSMPCQWFDNS